MDFVLEETVAGERREVSGCVHHLLASHDPETTISSALCLCSITTSTIASSFPLSSPCTYQEIEGLSAVEIRKMTLAEVYT